VTEDPTGAQTHRLPDEDLSDAFGAPRRSAGLSTLVGARQRAARPQHAATSSPALPERADRGPKPQARTRVETAPPAGPERTSADEPDRLETVPPPLEAQPAAHAPMADRIYPTAVYVSPQVSARAEAYRRAQTGRTNADVVLDALEACHGRLGALLAAAREPLRPAGELFPGRPAIRRTAKAGVQLQFRPTHAQLAVIDRLVTEHRAASRSELIAAALDAFLPALKPRG
jgi:hypothetical protein